MMMARAGDGGLAGLACLPCTVHFVRSRFQQAFGREVDDELVMRIARPSSVCLPSLLQIQVPHYY